jgi:hypothetical protein
MTSCVCQRKRASLANEAASAPRYAAATAATAAASASPAGPAATGAASAASAASAAAGVLHAGLVEFLVENVERPQTDVGDFLFTERDFRARCSIPRIRYRSTHQRHRHANDSHNRYGLLQVLLLCLGHSESSMPAGKCYVNFVANGIICTLGTDTLQGHSPSEQALPHSCREATASEGGTFRKCA